MVELNPVNVRVCKKIFKMIDPKATPKIHTGSFIKGSRNEYNPKMKFHVIMGNPPYNKGGIKAKNTAKNQRDQKGSETIWPQFVQKSLSLLDFILCHSTITNSWRDNLVLVLYSEIELLGYNRLCL